MPAPPSVASDSDTSSTTTGTAADAEPAKMLRRPSYSAKPVIRAAPVPAASPQPGPADEPAAPGTEAEQASGSPAESKPAKKALPPALAARLAKRGILPKVHSCPNAHIYLAES